MTAPSPRLPALTDAELPESLRPILAAWPYRLHRTLAHAPDSLKAWMPWAEHILKGNSLAPRDREIAILRVAWNAQCGYEWGLHAWVARQVGMTDDDLSAVVAGSDSIHWTQMEAALVAGVDALMATNRLPDVLWATLSGHLTAQQLIDFIYLTGQFTTIAWVLNGLNLAPEDGVEPLPGGGLRGN